MFDKPPAKIIWCYGVYQDLYKDFSKLNIKLHEGILNIETVDKSVGTLLILDDLMYCLNDDVGKIYTMFSHHLNLTVFLLSQNIFCKSKIFRTITLNSHYVVLFSQRRDLSQIYTFAGQVAPYSRKEFLNIYKEATSKKYGYIMCVFHPKNIHRFYLRYNIFPNEVETVFYAV